MSANSSQVTDTTELTPVSDYEFLGNTYTVERKQAFIIAFREEGSVYHAARVAQVSRKTIYNWIQVDEQFAEAVEDSKEDNYDQAETSVFKKALAGDSLLLMFYLKAHRPKFRDKVQVDLNAVQSDIDDLMQRVGQKQLPVATTGFIDTDYSTSENEYQSIDNNQASDDPDKHFPVPSQLQQKED